MLRYMFPFVLSLMALASDLQELIRIETFAQGTGINVFLEDSRSMVHSADGRFLYTSSPLGFAVFERDTVTGNLSLLQILEDEVTTNITRPMVMSPDGSTIYAGRNSILTQLNVMPDGTVSRIALPAIDRPVHKLAMNPTLNWLYATNFDDYTLRVFRVDPENAGIELMVTYNWTDLGVDGLRRPGPMAVSNDGMNVYLTSETDGASIVNFVQDPNLSDLYYVEHFGRSDFNNMSLAWPALSPDNRHLYVSAEATRRIFLFDRDANDNGRLSYVAEYTMPDRPTWIVVSPDGRFVFAGSRIDHSVSVLTRSDADGSLVFQHELNESDWAQLAAPYGIWAPAGADGAYCLNPNTGNLLWLDQDDVSGDLQEGGMFAYGNPGIQGLDHTDASVATAEHLYVASANEDLISFFDRSPDGLLTYHGLAEDPADPLPGLQEIGHMAVSPDEAFVYYASSGMLVVTERDPATGLLAPLQTLTNASIAAAVLTETSDLEISADGKNLYLTSSVDHALSVFDRDPVTGLLTYATSFFDGSGGVDGLNGAGALSVAGDGGNVYVAGPGDDGICGFARDTATGALTFQEFYPGVVPPVGPTYGLKAALDVLVSPDGAFVYAVGATETALLTYTRTPGTGLLTFLDVNDTTRAGFLTFNGDATHLLMANDPILFFQLGDDGIPTLDESFDLASPVTRLVRADDEHIYGAVPATDDLIHFQSRSARFDYDDEILFAVNGGEGNKGIWRVTLWDNSSAEIVPTGPYVNDPVAVDVANGSELVYWADRGLGQILRAGSQGENPEVVIDSIGEVWDMALDSQNGKVYWLSQFPERGLFRANLDGSDREQLLPDFYSAMELDLTQNRLFLFDHANQDVMRADLDGGNLALVLGHNSGSNFLHYNATDNTLYYGENGSSIFRYHLDTGLIYEPQPGNAGGTAMFVVTDPARNLMYCGFLSSFDGVQRAVLNHSAGVYELDSINSTAGSENRFIDAAMMVPSGLIYPIVPAWGSESQTVCGVTAPDITFFVAYVNANGCP